MSGANATLTPSLRGRAAADAIQGPERKELDRFVASLLAMTA